jgi:hypothetical protein
MLGNCCARATGQGNDHCRSQTPLYSVKESTIRFAKKNKDKMRGSVETIAPTNEKISCVKFCNRFLEKMEKALHVNNWKMEMVDVMAPYKAVLKKTKQSTITSSLAKVSVFPPLCTSLHLITSTGFSQED